MGAVTERRMPRPASAAGLLVLVLSGCAGGDPAAPTPSSAPAPAAAAPAAPVGSWTYRAAWTRPDGQATGIEYQLDVQESSASFRAGGVQTQVNVGGRLEPDGAALAFVTDADQGSVPPIAPGTRLLRIERNGEGLQVTPQAGFAFENAGGATSVFFAAAAPNRSTPFQLTITPDDRARARLESGPEDIEVLVTFSGSGGTPESPNEREVRLLLGPKGGTLEVPATELTPTLPDGGPLTDVLVSVYSARKSAPDNLLSCTLVSGQTAALQATYDVSCTLI